MQAAAYLSVEEYFALEADSEMRHEYCDGVIIDMAGGSEAHGLIKDNTSAAFRQALAGRTCRIITSDLRVKVSATRYRYPDVVVYCHDPAFVRLPRTGDTLANPEVIVEVLSEGTAYADLVIKLDEYTALPSVQEYWIISQEEPRVIQHLRQDAVWVVRSLRGMEQQIKSPHLGIALALADLYALVSWPEEGRSEHEG